MKSWKIGNVEIVRYEDDKDDTLRVSSDHLSESVELINRKKFKNVAIGGQYELTEIEFLKECPSIENLTLNSDEVKDFRGLAYLENVKILSLDIDNKSKIDLGNMVSLQGIYGKLPANTNGLSKLKNLRSLRLWNFKSSTKSLLELAKAESLEELILTQTQIQSLQGIGNLKKLKKLELNSLRTLVDIADLKGVNNTLEILTIESCKKIEDYSPIASLQSLKKLELIACGAIKSIDFIKELSNLELFAFVETNVLDGNLSYCEGIESIYFNEKKHYSHSHKDLNASAY
jgi:hypothetical protein